MRRLTDADRIRQLMQMLGAEADRPAHVYFTEGATAVLVGWRPTTIDVDMRIIPEVEKLLRMIPQIKEQLQMNIGLACPADFIPELPGWEERSLSIGREGQVDFFHYDPYAQALAKIERGHRQDLEDIRAMMDRGLVDPKTIRRFFDEMEPLLYRYPAIHPPSFRKAVEEAVGSRPA